jgi:aspartyl-tRNA(Asn)/glutamyl-tRNA(Gln) amidotransferase subunit A
VSADWTLARLGAAVAARRISPVEITEACLAAIAKLDARLRAFITVDGEGARATARAREAEVMAGRVRGPLHGLPVAHKDLCRVAGAPTSCGTATADYFVADVECTAAVRLREAGAVTLGKLSMSELAVGPFGDNAHHGDAVTPWRAGHCAGGSSSGSAVAVAAGLALGTLGSDTGGSIRLPAACCGVVGLKPTYGRVSRAGVMPLSWSMDHVGPLARTVEDAALLLGVIAGHDPRDATSSRRPVDLDGWREPVAGLRIGVPENYYFDGLESEVEGAVRAAAEALARQGARLRALRVPDPALAADVGTLVARAESASIHARLVRERPETLQPAVRTRLEVGLAVTAYDYLQALRVRARLARTFATEVFGEVDVVLAPVVPEPAPVLAAVKAGTVEDVVRRMGRFSRLTRPFNTLGLPALALPCGVSADGRPLALQIVGRPFDEATVLRVGVAWEREAGGWRPPPAA